MTVEEAIAMLQKFHPRARVVVGGREGGLDDVVLMERKEVYLDVNKEGYYGPHEEVGKRSTASGRSTAGKEKAQAVVLSIDTDC
jgi:hypothetical protein